MKASNMGEQDPKVVNMVSIPICVWQTHYRISESEYSMSRSRIACLTSGRRSSSSTSEWTNSCQRAWCITSRQLSPFFGWLNTIKWNKTAIATTAAPTPPTTTLSSSSLTPLTKAIRNWPISRRKLLELRQPRISPSNISPPGSSPTGPSYKSFPQSRLTLMASPNRTRNQQISLRSQSRISLTPTWWKRRLWCRTLLNKR